MSKKVRERSRFIIYSREARDVLLPLLRYLLKEIPIHFSSDGDRVFCAKLIANRKPRFIGKTIPDVRTILCSKSV